MTCASSNRFALLMLLVLCAFSSAPVFSGDHASLIEVTPNIKEYALQTVQPVLGSYEKKDSLSLLMKVDDILLDDETGIHTNEITPGTYIIYDKLELVKLGFLITLNLSTEQKKIVRTWHSKFMRRNPADVFFAPSADEIVKTKAAFGCSHYARTFVAVVKALGLVAKPEDLRYVISSKADDYDQALDKKDSEMTINGHQFAVVRMGSKWIAINTSKSEWTSMPEGFTPDSVRPPENIPIRFASYPEVTFLLRRIGKDYNEDGGDGSLDALMNIYRSGDARAADFKWERFGKTDNQAHPDHSHEP